MSKPKTKRLWHGEPLIKTHKIWEDGVLIVNESNYERPIRGQAKDPLPPRYKEYQHIYQEGRTGYVVDTVYFDEAGLGYVFDDENGMTYRVAPMVDRNWLIIGAVR